MPAGGREVRRARDGGAGVIDHTGATQPRGRMRARTAFAITALFAALTVARGMEFDLVDRYARASRATRQPPTTRAPSTINGAASSGFPRAEIRAAFH